MDLNASLSIAGSGLASINAQLAVVSHNVANASTPGYVEESVPLRALDAAGIGMGVFTAPSVRSVDDVMLQQAVLTQTGSVGDLQTTANALSSLEVLDGSPGQGLDLGSLRGKLQDSFSTLLNDPSSQTQQAAVVNAAASLAQGINSRSEAITTQRQSAQDDIVASVRTINDTLSTIGMLSGQIMQAKAAGASTADLQDQRDSQIATLSQLLSIHVLPQANGDVLITTASGLELPTHSTTAPLAASAANVQPGAYYPGGGLPGVSLNGQDVTGALTGGQLGADIALRDSILPTHQAALDEFSKTLADRFAAQGLTLFTGSAGTVPASTGPNAQNGYVGFAATIQVNPAVEANPSLVRDGTPSANASNAAGFNTTINNVLANTFGPAGPAPSTTGLGPDGTLSLSYTAPLTLAVFATDISSSVASAAGDAANRLQTEQGVQTALQNRLTSETGVSIDAEMSHMIALQNAYGANARVMAAVQSMFSDVLGIVGG